MTIYLAASAYIATLLSMPAVAEPAAGALLYQQNCAVCHGANGDGGVGIPLNLPDFLAVASDDYLRATLREGRPGRVMPAFPSLDDAQVNAIIEHIRSWSKQPRPQYSDERLSGEAQRGATLFRQHNAA